MLDSRLPNYLRKNCLLFQIKLKFETQNYKLIKKKNNYKNKERRK